MTQYWHIPSVKLWITTVLAIASISSAAWAASTLSQGYLSSKPLSVGQIVSLEPNPQLVTAADTDNSDSLTGVVISPQSVVLSVGDITNEVNVANNGIVDTLVSTINGDIKVGDRITVSPLQGIGQKATTSTRILGISQASFDAKTAGAEKQTIKDRAGNNRDVYLGHVPVLVGITFYSTGTAVPNPVPSFLQHFANAVAGKPVATLPILISLVIFIVVLLTSGVILYTAIRSSIISVGRNPLAKSGVIRSLIQVSLMVTLLICAGLVAIYFILRLI